MADAAAHSRDDDDQIEQTSAGPDGGLAGGQHPLDRLQSLLLNVEGLDSVLTELAQLATRVVAPTSCGITVRYDNQLLTVGSSDPRAEALDETQYRTHQGPCLEALATGQIVDLVDADREGRWPDYLPAARATGMRCSLSLPLSDTDRHGADVEGTRSFGAMNVYGFDRPGMFGESEGRQLELFAARISGTLLVARRLVRDSALLGQMDEALNSRTVIDQALGIIMGRQRCTSSEAFELLRRESQNTRRRLRDIATDLVARTTGQAPRPGRDFDHT